MTGKKILRRIRLCRIREKDVGYDPCGDRFFDSPEKAHTKATGLSMCAF